MESLRGIAAVCGSALPFNSPCATGDSIACVQHYVAGFAAMFDGNVVIDQLSVTVLPSDTAGTVASSPAGLACPGPCVLGTADTMPVTLTASAAPGWTFDAWSGACAGLDAATVVVPTAESVHCVARFVPAPADGGEQNLDASDASADATDVAILSACSAGVNACDQCVSSTCCTALDACVANGGCGAALGGLHYCLASQWPTETCYANFQLAGGAAAAAVVSCAGPACTAMCP